jgi:hypothetical protein
VLLGDWSNMHDALDAFLQQAGNIATAHCALLSLDWCLMVVASQQSLPHKATFSLAVVAILLVVAVLKDMAQFAIGSVRK